MMSTLLVTRYVGIVYGPNDSPVYCRSDGRYWRVINGGWGFAKKNQHMPFSGNPEWKIILRNMGKMGWEKACQLITKKATKLNERKNLRI